MRLPIPSIQDIASVVLGEDRNVDRALLEYYERGGGNFNYNPARNIGIKYLKGGLKTEVAVASCYKIGSPAGHEQNAEVGKLLCHWASGRSFNFYGLSKDFLQIGQKLAVPVPIEGYLVEEGSASFLWMQPRKSFNPNQAQLSMIGTCIKDVYGSDDFEEVGLSILDFSAPVKGEDRVLTVYGYEDLDLLSRAELSELLTAFATAYHSLVKAGYSKPVRPTKEKRPDERQRDLF